LGSRFLLPPSDWPFSADYQYAGLVRQDEPVCDEQRHAHTHAPHGSKLHVQPADHAGPGDARRTLNGSVTTDRTPRKCAAATAGPATSQLDVVLSFDTLVRMDTPPTSRDTECHSDAQLLADFLATGRCEPLTEVLRRHTSMMYSVARRITGSVQDAEDVLQAVSLIVAAQAGRLLAGPSIAGWLYQVTRRTALDLRRSGLRRHTRESVYAQQRNLPVSDPSCMAQPVDEETMQLLHQAIHDLPSACRDAVVLCYLEQKTQEQAAVELGCPRRTISDRLHKARQMLQKALRRRGVTLSLGALTAVLAGEGALAAAIPPSVTASVMAACAAAAGPTTTGGGAVSAVAVALAKSVSAKMAVLHATKMLAIVLGGLMSVATGGIATYQWLKPQPASVRAIPQRTQFFFQTNPSDLSGLSITSGGKPGTVPANQPQALLLRAAHLRAAPIRVARHINGRPVAWVEIEATVRGPTGPVPWDVELTGFAPHHTHRLTFVAADAPGDVRFRGGKSSGQHDLRWVLTESQEGSGTWDLAVYSDARHVHSSRVTGQPTDFGLQVTGPRDGTVWLTRFAVRGFAETTPAAPAGGQPK
jgi:RNA polymerase sigma factor (sigma-70 family)